MDTTTISQNKNWCLKDNYLVPDLNNIAFIALVGGIFVSIAAISVAVALNYPILADHADGISGHEEILQVKDIPNYETQTFEQGEYYACAFDNEERLAFVAILAAGLFGCSGIMACSIVLFCHVGASDPKYKMRKQLNSSN
jgi:hypothetical protein